MTQRSEEHLVVETTPDRNDIHFLEEEIYAFNVQATGIADGILLAVFLRGPDDKVIGGAYGWTWGSTCYVRDLFVPENMRNQGHGTKIMRAIEKEAAARGCVQIVLETHSFQAPEFYGKLGFAVSGIVDSYPRGTNGTLGAGQPSIPSAASCAHCTNFGDVIKRSNRYWVVMPISDLPDGLAALDDPKSGPAQIVDSLSLSQR